MHILVKPSYRQTRIGRKAATARMHREHRAFHVQRAEQMRAEADAISRELDRMVDDVTMPEGLKDAMNGRILDLRTAAIAEENGACMENHG